MLTWAWFCFLTCMNCVSFVVCWRVRLIADTQTFLNVLSVRSAGRETVGGLGFEWIHLWTKWSTTSDFCGDLIFERTETDKDFFFVVLLLNNITVDFNQSTHDRSYEWTCKKHQFLCTVANFQVTCWNVIGRCSNDYKWKKKTEMKKDQNVHVKVQKCTWVGHAANKHVTALHVDLQMDRNVHGQLIHFRLSWCVSEDVDELRVEFQVVWLSGSRILGQRCFLLGRLLHSVCRGRS